MTGGRIGFDRPRTDADAAGAPADGIAEATGVARTTGRMDSTCPHRRDAKRECDRPGVVTDLCGCTLEIMRKGSCKLIIIIMIITLETALDYFRS